VSGPRTGGTCGDARRDGLEEVVADVEERRMAGNGAAAGFTAAALVRRWRGAGLVWGAEKKECVRFEHAFIC
jgi:hypothetical protein